MNDSSVADVVDGGLIKLAMGSQYYLPLPEGTRFEWDGGWPRLIIGLDNMTKDEEQALRSGETRFGLLPDGKLLRFIYSFALNGQTVIDGDCVYNATLYPSFIKPQASKILSKARYCLTVEAVETTTNTVRVLRAITLSPKVSHYLDKLVLRQIEEPISRETYYRLVNESNQRYPSTRSCIKNALVFERGGTP